MLVGGIIDISTKDIPYRASMVIFTAGCNFKCNFCHNKFLLYTVMKKKKKKQLSAVMEEVGELVRDINHLEGFKPKKGYKSSNVGEELGDLFFSIICLANYYKSDLSKKFCEVLEKYSKRDANKYLI